MNPKCLKNKAELWCDLPHNRHCVTMKTMTYKHNYEIYQIFLRKQKIQREKHPIFIYAQID